MKRLNIKLIITLLVSTGAFAVGVYFLHDFQSRRRADGLLLLADQMREEQDYLQEANLRRRYISRRPEDTEQYGNVASAYAKLIEQSLAEGKFDPKIFQNAFRFYEQGIRNAPDNIELRKGAIEFFLDMRRYKDAISHLEHLRNQQGTLEPEMQVKLALCYLRGGEEDRSREMLSKMVGFDPASYKFDREAATAPSNRRPDPGPR